MHRSPTRIAATTFADRATPMTATFKAWRKRDPLINQVVPLEIAATTLNEAVASASASCSHKDHILVLEQHPHGKQTLHIYAIKQGKREYRGVALGYVAPLYPAHLFSTDVIAFAPSEPFRWAPGCDVVGIDRSVIDV